jgi:hypothetical protein
MNIYFLVEGKTERRVYPKWLSHLLPDFTRIDNAYDATKQNFYLFYGGGFPSLLHNHLKNAIEEINDINRYDYLVICLDSDDFSVEERRNEVLQFVENEKLTLNNFTELVVVVQNRCIETWFLGNPKIMKSNTEKEVLKNFIAFYNVAENDPEQMPSHENFRNHASFHEAYLKEMLQERNVFYSKTIPREVDEKYYLDELINRFDTTQHIPTFGYFLDFLRR